jgi:hypothetical protein|tara:strand:+ start:760 stop:1089 length:330 start_codon:yes stop_codon:yes gene_type:complete
MSVFFRKVNINKGTNTATVIASSAPLGNKKAMIAGVEVATRDNSNITFGVLSLMNPTTGKTCDADSEIIKHIQKNVNVGDEMKDFQMTDNFVMDMKTNEPTTLRWIEAV